MPSGRPGTTRDLLGRAWAVRAARGQTRHGPVCWSGRAGSTDLGPGLVVPVSFQPGRPIWPSILIGLEEKKISLRLLDRACIILVQNPANSRMARVPMSPGVTGTKTEANDLVRPWGAAATQNETPPSDE